MCDGNRSPFGYLFFEEWDDAAAAADDIAETNGNKLGGTCPEGLQQFFSHALGGAHNA